MNGIVGMLRLDGQPVDRAQLAALAHATSIADAPVPQTSVDGPMGLACVPWRAPMAGVNIAAPLRAGPLSVVADARIDDQDALRAKLDAAGAPCPAQATDCDLILAAFRAWGSDCVHHLVGDFAFAAWDADAQRLFLARDHIGIRVLYHAQVGPTFIFSSAFDAVRRFPGVSQDLDEHVIGDYLIAGHNLRPHTTGLKAVQRLAPAHTLIVTAASTQARRYWSLPQPDLLRLPRDEDYVAAFRACLDRAVLDRIRGARVAVPLSGGMDSSSLAATIVDRAPACEVRAYTVVSDLRPDPEQPWAALIAEHLGIGIEYFHTAVLTPPPFPDTHGPPAPDPGPIASGHHQAFCAAAAFAPICFSGFGGDPALFPSMGYFPYLARRGQYGQILADSLDCIRLARRTPPLYLRIYARDLRSKPRVPDFPAWISPEFAAQQGLVERWRAYHAAQPAPVHPWRNAAYTSLISPVWSYWAEHARPPIARLPLEVAYPLLDIRLLTLALSLPPIPWCVNKLILRRAMAGRLPPAVLKRPKTPLGWIGGTGRLAPALTEIGEGELGDYLDIAAYRAEAATWRQPAATARVVAAGEPLYLAAWLRTLANRP
jgi:asparagine synthase (glutamine-hydrolysing)